MTREPLHERKGCPRGQATGAFLMPNVALHSSQVPQRFHRPPYVDGSVRQNEF
ncbi:hypothetical protein AWB74_08523 [Caballeronia arvi]|uniref:Uncharacterized protein n=1 Tax=Caballeronia arvi TaxID=1777135 RepID=A0A158L5W0_9BURK|nr:hypothetical protein [Caballeronia arvi]SAL88353.1 hypothetical protein AWB74_08523 [Caballeronia arvi]